MEPKTNINVQHATTTTPPPPKSAIISEGSPRNSGASLPLTESCPNENENDTGTGTGTGGTTTEAISPIAAGPPSAPPTDTNSRNTNSSTDPSSVTSPPSLKKEEEENVDIPTIPNVPTHPPLASTTSSSRGGRSTNNSSSNTNSSNSSSSNNNHKPSDALRRVTRVSRHAALTTKQAVWDSNELSIDAALSAVDQWEGVYTAIRSLLVASVASARNVYGAAKEGAGQLEHMALVPVRDWILLPAFTGAERAVAETGAFLRSDTARQLAGSTLHWVRCVPGIGDTVLAPGLQWSAVVVQRTWNVLQYPIPSRHQVRVTVDWSLTGTKWALAAAAREVCLYAKRADANITRTLSHTQWKVLGSGPYATLDPGNKGFVIDHLCERYFSVATDVGRYELAAHVKRHNPALHFDLVVTGILKERGGDITEHDEWLNSAPVYRASTPDDPSFLLPCNSFSKKDADHTVSENESASSMTTTTTKTIEVQLSSSSASSSALWFRLPQVNGKPPAKDAAWTCFRKQEQRELEIKYRNAAQECTVSAPNKEQPNILVDHNKEQASSAATMDENSFTNSFQETPKRCNHAHKPSSKTCAQWYTPNSATDVMVDQKRHAVTFYLHCHKCRDALVADAPLSIQQYGDDCESCRNATGQPHPRIDSARPFGLPPMSMIMRPVLWRFHGPGDEVRRATWFLDTARNGLQPFDCEAQAVLEDAYLFLKWISYRRTIDPNKSKQNENGVDVELDESILTVEVQGPDGTDRLVQFSSLTQATAIQKGLGAAMAIFKRRVYRGAWLQDSVSDDAAFVELIDAPERSDSMCETNLLEVSLRSVLDPSSPVNIQPKKRPPSSGQTFSEAMDVDNIGLSVPADRLTRGDIAKCLRDEKEGNIDHLCLIVHGIGEMLRSVDLFGMTLPNLVSVCGSMRSNHAEIQDAHARLMQENTSSKVSGAPGRVEYLPVEWHESFSALTQRRPSVSSIQDQRNVLIEDISLKTIPNMREFANDTLMDILFFMSPEHHQIIIEVVTREMNLVVRNFRDVTGFDGRISVVGHSLGSIISWDILDNQIESTSTEQSTSTDCHLLSTSSFETKVESAESLSDNNDTPEVTPVMTHKQALVSTGPQLDFKVDNFFLLGSPVPVFLMIRNQRSPLSEDFYLSGCRRVFNIFHPYDPVAYRLEGCIDPRNAAFEPALIRHWNGGLRVQYRTRKLWRKLVETTCNTQRTVVAAFEQSIAGAFGIGRDYYDSASEASDEIWNSRIRTGRLNEGRRIDYMLQEKEIENANEYVAALAAHSSYWIEKDLSLFIARQIYLSTIVHSAAEEEAAELASWETITPDQFNSKNI